MTERFIYMVEEVAEIFHVTSRTVYSWISEGRMGTIVIRGKVRGVSPNGMREFIINHEIPPDEYYKQGLTKRQYKERIIEGGK